MMRIRQVLMLVAQKRLTQTMYQDMQLKQQIAHMRADIVSSQWEEAEASGWRRYAMTLISRPSQTVWISVCVLSFLH